PCEDEGSLVRLDEEGWTEVASPGLTSSFEMIAIPLGAARELGIADPTFALLRPGPPCEAGPLRLEWLIGENDSSTEALPATGEVDAIRLWDADNLGGFWAYLADPRPSDQSSFEGAMLVHHDGVISRY